MLASVVCFLKWRVLRYSFSGLRYPVFWALDLGLSLRISYFEFLDTVSYIGTAKLGKCLPRYCMSLKDTANVSTGEKKEEYRRRRMLSRASRCNSACFALP